MRSIIDRNFKFDATFFWYYPPRRISSALTVKQNHTIALEGILRYI